MPPSEDRAGGRGGGGGGGMAAVDLEEELTLAPFCVEETQQIGMSK